MRGQLRQSGRIIGHIDHHGDVVMVLGSRPNHCRTTDVDVLDAGCKVAAFRNGRLEWIEIDHQQVDRPDAVRLHRCGVLGVGADRQQSAMHAGVQRLHPSVHHFGEAGQFGYVEHLEPGVGQRLTSAASGDQFDTVRRKRAGKIDKTGLVGHGQQSARDAAKSVGHVGSSGNCGSSPRPRRGVGVGAAVVSAKVHCTRITLRARP